MDNGPFGPSGPFGPGGGRRGFVEPAGFPLHHGGPGALAWAIFALVLALVVGFAIAAVLQLVAGRPPRWRYPVPAGGPPIDPATVLSMRYARGEIGRDDFMQAADDLRPRPPEPQEPPPSAA